MARRDSRPGKRSAGGRAPAARPAAGRTPAAGDLRGQEPQQASTAGIAAFLAVAAVLTSLVFWPLSMALGLAAAVVAVVGLRRGTGSRTVLVAAGAGGAVAFALSALGAYLVLSR